jgi:hypothetical protein
MVILTSTIELIEGQASGYLGDMTVLRSVLLFALAEIGGAGWSGKASVSTAAWPSSAPASSSSASMAS